jgi:hypothetical protein
MFLEEMNNRVPRTPQHIGKIVDRHPVPPALRLEFAALVSDPADDATVVIRQAHELHRLSGGLVWRREGVGTQHEEDLARGGRPDGDRPAATNGP